MTRPRAQRARAPQGAISSEVALGMAHEIGNLLGAIQLRLQVLALDDSCLRAQAPNIRAMERILDEANELVQRVQALGFSSELVPGAGNVQLVDLDKAVTEAIQLAGSGLRLQARRAGVELRIKKALGQLPPVRGVPALIRQRLVGLLISARHAFPRGGTLRVVGRRMPGAVVLSVENARGLAQSRGAKALGKLELRLPSAAPTRARSPVAQ